MKKIFLLFISLFSVIILFAQTHTISGYIKDASTGEEIIGAVVYIAETQKNTITNNFGFYSINFQGKDSLELEVSYLGYENKKERIFLNSDTIINFNLHISENLIEEVFVKANKNQILNLPEMSTIEISVNQVKNIPAIAGETDIMKAIQLMPGVQSGGEGQSGLYVRGGSPDQNLILLDDVPLYYINHFGGFVSIFNTDAVKSVKLIKGGFPARYGNRLSSVLDIHMKEGNMKKYVTHGTVGIISSKLSLEGPVKKDTSSFIISVRRFMLDLISKPLTYFITDRTSVGYTFYDINTKINYKINNTDRIYLSFYGGKDKTSAHTYETDKSDKEKMNYLLAWGNILGALRWNHLYNNKLFGNMTFTYTQYKYLTNMYYQNKEIYNENNKEYITEYQDKFNSNIKDIKLKYNFEYYLSSKYRFRFGINAVYHMFTPGVSSFKHFETNQSLIDSTYNNKKYNAFENYIYAENYINFGKKIKTNIGIHISSYTINKHTFFSFEPRILLNYRITRHNSLKASYARMQQNVHLLSYSGLGVPSDIWLPAVIHAPPEISDQFVLGNALLLFSKNYEFTSEIFYKKIQNLISYKQGRSFYNGFKNWEENILTNGKGKSYGIEFLLRKKYGNINGWIAYTLSRTKRQFDEINKGNWYLFRYDRTHDISIVIIYNINKKINFSAAWVYTTGNAITLPNEKYKMSNPVYKNIYPYISYKNTNYVSSFNEKNSFRMRDFHKLDIGINYIKQKKRWTIIWNLSIYNVYNRQNPYFYFFKKVYKKDNSGNNTNKYEIKLFQQSLFPIIPSISYSFKF